MSLRIIPVIDLRAGRAVRGRGGERGLYAPVCSRLGGGAATDLSDPVRLLRAYVLTLRSATVYIADLDRIEAVGDHEPLLAGFARTAPGVRFLWDGGFRHAPDIARLSRNGRIVPVLGTETMIAPADLARVPRPATGSRPTLSLDLTEAGVLAGSPEIAAMGEVEILRRAAGAGFTTAILLLIGRVGTGRGLPRERLRRLQDAACGLDLCVGGGIATMEDLDFLARSGFRGALLSRALHDGTIGARDLEAAGFLQEPVS
jgi:phosphoribosylformimino-5-aminoimidazole carboxamide ribotide isomerase